MLKNKCIMLFPLGLLLLGFFSCDQKRINYHTSSSLSVPIVDLDSTMVPKVQTISNGLKATFVDPDTIVYFSPKFSYIIAGSYTIGTLYTYNLKTHKKAQLVSNVFYEGLKDTEAQSPFNPVLSLQYPDANSVYAHPKLYYLTPVDGLQHKGEISYNQVSFPSLNIQRYNTKVNLGIRVHYFYPKLMKNNNSIVIYNVNATAFAYLKTFNYSTDSKDEYLIKLEDGHHFNAAPSFVSISPDENYLALQDKDYTIIVPLSSMKSPICSAAKKQYFLGWHTSDLGLVDAYYFQLANGQIYLHNLNTNKDSSFIMTDQLRFLSDNYATSMNQYVLLEDISTNELQIWDTKNMNEGPLYSFDLPKDWLPTNTNLHSLDFSFYKNQLAVSYTDKSSHSILVYHFDKLKAQYQYLGLASY